MYFNQAIYKHGKPQVASGFSQCSQDVCCLRWLSRMKLCYRVSSEAYHYLESILTFVLHFLLKILLFIYLYYVNKIKKNNYFEKCGLESPKYTHKNTRENSRKFIWILK